ncbi:MAG: DUF4345 domain-containing protein [Polyangiaceae bacterium]|nr:DUF4345 domain-containing protein [Polyangiaceae bacterium]
MRLYSTVLKLSSLIFIAVAAVHLLLGLGADQMLGAVVPPGALTEPSLDSQNRFYGVAFALYGVALYICAKDLVRFGPILKAVLAVFFLAGCARLVSWGIHGRPAPLVMGLLATELVLPPLLYLWLQKIIPSSGQS